MDLRVLKWKVFEILCFKEIWKKENNDVDVLIPRWELVCTLYPLIPIDFFLKVEVKV
jgi:hypothetical protein